MCGHHKKWCPYDLWKKHIDSRFYSTMDEVKTACEITPTKKDFENDPHTDLKWNKTIKTEQLKIYA